MSVPLSTRATKRQLFVALILGIPGLSCTPSQPDEAGAEPLAASPTLSGDVVPVASPAGPGSAEPHLSSGVDGVVLSWLEPEGADRHLLRVVRWNGTAWSAPHTVVADEELFVNWADFPSVTDIDGTLYAHWLKRGGQGGYDYGVRVARSLDGGESWTRPWTPHDDVTPTEHGFVSTFPHPDGGAGLVWLDGRRFVAGPEGAPATDEMTLLARRVARDGTAGPEVLLDDKVCDCCQTDAVVTSEGPLVVYRDRRDDEVRDVFVTRLIDGAWTGGRAVHRDGWRISACPVNGPAAAARGPDVVVAWFTQARDTAAVKVALSTDAGASFGPPVRVDAGRPLGRVDVVLGEDRSAFVSWIERVSDGGAELRVRRVRPDGEMARAATVSAVSGARAAGFPQLALTEGALLFAWTSLGTDGGQRVETARAEPEGP